jgi:Glycosyl hydrolases family 2/Glycosyl hydrolases family 2, sugar binding domain/Glycosyl hydrolases family 2, TIM barrel domain
MSRKTESKDTFADIASQLKPVARAGMSAPPRVPVPETTLPLQTGAPAMPRPLARKIGTAEELKNALDALRARMSPFLQDLAPPLPATRSVFDIKRSQWRVETPEDRSSFADTLAGKGEWTVVDLPHYGPPLGPAATIYRAELDLPPALFDAERRILCFDGVDYCCQVYLNGVCLGTHEGFFEPFEFDVTGIARAQGNVLLVRVENDYTMLGQAFSDGDADGDKIYAATGLGYDDPEEGWHHCPAGMGIWQGVRMEGRSRLAITDIFVRPLASLDAVEIEVTVENYGDNPQEVASLLVSIHGQNFPAHVHIDHAHEGQGRWVRGFGDLEKNNPDSEPARMGRGKNFLSLTLPVPDGKIWDLETPWLYQAQVKLVDGQGKLLDAARRQFGLRRFEQDENSEPKGKFFLNGREILLRGANTMGNLDLCVFRGDTARLHDDILLAKLTNMNFLRLTQHPVQREIYEACDRLGLMLQTDLPLFGNIRRNQFHECVRQSAAMEHLVRSHPCSILVSFINEPFPAARAKPHRFMQRDEMEKFFEMASMAVRRENPDRVIKCVDGDYDPPVRHGMQDNHCYCGWYIGHGVDLGSLHHGNWMEVKEGWHFGCGEFGSEGLDSRGLMEEFYPSAWLPSSAQADWSPEVIPKAQSAKFHYLWYPTQRTRDEWIEASQRHQEWITRLMTEAFRRLPGMNTFAIHLFIDAWPAGWMKTIMDMNRVPKRAWFTYRDALAPVAVQLRSDRTAGFAGQTLPVELWTACDLPAPPEGCRLVYEVMRGGKIIAHGSTTAKLARCGPSAHGVIDLALPDVDERENVTVAASLLDSDGHALHHTSLTITVFPQLPAKGAAPALAGNDPRALAFLQSLGLSAPRNKAEEDVILVTDISHYLAAKDQIDRRVRNGATAVFLSLPEGSHTIGDATVAVRAAGMGSRHFVSCDSSHPLAEGFLPQDFKFWFDQRLGYASPILHTVLEGEGWAPILLSGDGGWSRPWGPAAAAMEKKDGQGAWRICQVDLLDRVRTNPVAHLFAHRLLESASHREAAVGGLQPETAR